MKHIPVLINGKLHRLSERALELLNLKVVEHEKPINIQKLPPDITILKIAKKEVSEVPKEVPKEVIAEVQKEVPVEVKKRGCKNCGKRKKQ